MKKANIKITNFIIFNGVMKIMVIQVKLQYAWQTVPSSGILLDMPMVIITLAR